MVGKFEIIELHGATWGICSIATASQLHKGLVGKSWNISTSGKLRVFPIDFSAGASSQVSLKSTPWWLCVADAERMYPISWRSGAGSSQSMSRAKNVFGILMVHVLLGWRSNIGVGQGSMFFEDTHVLLLSTQFLSPMAEFHTFRQVCCLILHSIDSYKVVGPFSDVCWLVHPVQLSLPLRSSNVSNVIKEHPIKNFHL